MFTIGKKPKLSFKIEAFIDGKTVTLPFSDLLDGPTLVSVYMRNNTSACDKQVTELIKNHKLIDKQGFKVVIVSRDTATSHAKYAQKLGVKFPLVSDPDDLFSEAMDAVVEKSMYGKKYFGPARAAYLFNDAKKLIGLIPKVDAAEHGKQVLEAILALKK